jgi:hypothetical protein
VKESCWREVKTSRFPDQAAGSRVFRGPTPAVCACSGPASGTGAGTAVIADSAPSRSSNLQNAIFSCLQLMPRERCNKEWLFAERPSLTHPGEAFDGVTTKQWQASLAGQGHGGCVTQRRESWSPAPSRPGTAPSWLRDPEVTTVEHMVVHRRHEPFPLCFRPRCARPSPERRGGLSSFHTFIHGFDDRLR